MVRSYVARQLGVGGDPDYRAEGVITDNGNVTSGPRLRNRNPKEPESQIQWYCWRSPLVYLLIISYRCGHGNNHKGAKIEEYPLVLKLFPLFGLYRRCL